MEISSLQYIFFALMVLDNQLDSLKSYHNILGNALFKIYSLSLSSHNLRKVTDNVNCEYPIIEYLFMPTAT